MVKMTLNKTLQRCCCYTNGTKTHSPTVSTSKATSMFNYCCACISQCALFKKYTVNTNMNTTRHKLNYFIHFKMKTFLLSLTTILFYYLLSITLTFYNRMLFVTYKYPLSITIVHLIIKFSISLFLRYCIYLFTSQPRVLLNWNVYYKRIIPTSIASVIDIGLSNWSLQYITVTLYTMSKSTVILFILIFAILFKLEKWKWSLLFVALFISLGLFLFTFHSTEFHLFGFILVMFASLFSGIRWTLAQMLTQKHEIGLSNPIDMMYHIQPGMILSLLPLATYVEGVSITTTDKFFRNEDLLVVSKSACKILMGAFLAFLLEASEYLVISYTSSLTLSVSGIFKEICTIYLAVKLNNNELNTMNTIGLIICLFGIVIHVVVKARQEFAKGDNEIEKTPSLIHRNIIRKSQSSIKSTEKETSFTRTQSCSSPLLNH